MQYQFDFLSRTRSETSKAAAPEIGDRLFVPLADGPFRWFASGEKSWELRRLGRQYTPKHLAPGRRVELRRGYSNTTSVLWGRISDVREAPGIEAFFELVDYRKVVPTAKSRAEAVQMATDILGAKDDRVIGFAVDLDAVEEVPLHSDFIPLVRLGTKRSTVRKGVRSLKSGVADLVSGDEDRLRVLITDIETKGFEALTESDAKRDGFNSLRELEGALHRFYPDLGGSDPVTIIGFVPLTQK